MAAYLTRFARATGWSLVVVAVVGSLFASAALAGDADVVGVRVTRQGPATYAFAVTVRSRDTGWARYADLLEAVGADGRVLATRVLVHPHDDEQPFTRDIEDVRVPGAASVVVRVHFKPSGYGGLTKTFILPADAP